MVVVRARITAATAISTPAGAILVRGRPPTILVAIVARSAAPATPRDKPPRRGVGPTMAVPKRRMSRANTRSRRAQWKATKTELVGVTVAGQKHKVPRRLLKAARLGLIDLDRR